MEPTELKKWKARFEPLDDPLAVLPHAGKNAGQQKALGPSKEEALKLIGMGGVVSDEQYKALYTHPSEKVRVSFIKVDMFTVGNQERRNALEVLTSEAVREAKARHEVWTPVLEAIASKGYWESMGIGETSDEMYGYEEYLNNVLGEWVTLQEDETLEDFVKKTEVHQIFEVVASHMNLHGPDLVERLIEVKPHTAYHFSERAANSPDKKYADIVLKKLVEITTAPRYQKTREDYGVWLTGAYARLALRGHVFSEEQVEELLERLEILGDWNNPLYEKKSPLTGVLVIHGRYSKDKEFAKRFIDKLFAVEDDATVAVLFDSSVATHIAITEGGKKEDILELDLELALHIAGHIKGKETNAIDLYLSQLPEIRTIPEVRDALKEKKLDEVLHRLMLDRRPEDLKELFEKRLDILREQKEKVEQNGALLGKNADAVLYNIDTKAHTILTQYRDIAPDVLKIEDIDFLLRSELRDVRMFAIYLMGEIQERERTKQKTDRQATRPRVERA